VKYRAPVAFRAFVAILALGVALSNVTLLLSDRAPLVLRVMVGDFARQLSNRLDSDGQASGALNSWNVGNDSVVHFEM
jgi:hypothetical protein